MNKRIAAAWLIGFASYITLLISVVPPPTCADGTESDSIGRRGACSWHGGVRGSLWNLVALVGSVAIAVVFAKWPDIKEYVKSRSKREIAKKQAEEAQQTPYGSLKDYQAMLQKAGVSEDQIVIEVSKYRNRDNQNHRG